MPYRSLEIHHRMLSDTVRVRAYTEAIRGRCRPGMRVLDVGSGTGVWAVAAAMAGAREVVAVEPTDMITVARALAEASGVADRIRFMQNNLHEALEELRSSGPFDLVVSEMMGDLLIDEHLIPICRAAQGLLAPGGLQIPSTYELLVAPISLEEADAAPRFWRAGVDLPGLGRLETSPAAQLSENAPVMLPFPSESMLAPSAVLARLDASNLPERNGIDGTVSFALARSGTLTGIGLWWRSELAPGVTLSTGPDEPATHWGHGVFPLDRVTLVKGARVEVRLRADCSVRPQIWTWTVTAGDAPATSRTTFRAIAFGPEARARLAGTGDEDRPVIDSDALRFARLALLLDGSRTFAEAVRVASRLPSGAQDPAWGNDPVEEARRIVAVASRLRGIKK